MKSAWTAPSLNCTVHVIEMESSWLPSLLPESPAPSLFLRCGRAQSFGQLLRRVDDERRSLLIEKRGTPKAVLLSIRDYIRLAAPEPEVLRIIGEESERNGTDNLTPREIDRIIRLSRSQKRRR